MTILERLRTLEPAAMLSADDIFDAMASAGSSLADSSDREDDAALEISIRLLEARRKGQIPEGCLTVVEMLAEECGLYPYVNSEKFSLFGQSLIEAHAVQLDEKLYLHSKQMEILLHLLAGDNVILSAPTSFGKSMLVDAFLTYKSPATVVMLLPTIALIDETRRRLTRRFGDRYRIITTVTDEYDASVPTIFVLTQERFLQRRDVKKIDLLFVDEFYKLDPTRKDDRYENLNIALYRALPKSAQCFMAGPHIKNIFLGDQYRGNFRFVQTDYRTVSVNIFDRSAREDKKDALLSDLADVGEESSIVFTATPGSAQNLMKEFIEAGLGVESPIGTQLKAWIAENYHRAWPVGEGTERAIAVHHGRLPRSLGQLFIQLFDHGLIKILICTSTLIEGVNTSAANVFIFDKKINHRADLDFFSFANIRGRVGRMMRHFVGRAFLYYTPPDVVETNVEIPILSDPASSSDYILMNVENDELSPAGKTRKDQLRVKTGLSDLVLKEHGALGVDSLIAANDRIRQLLEEDTALLLWTGFPNKEQRIAIAEIAVIIARTRNEQFGLVSGKQVAWAWAQLDKISTLPKFLRWFERTFSPQDKAKGVDDAFRFLQACEFAFPRSLAAAESLVHMNRPFEKANYGPYIASLESWFRPAWMKQVDEAGIPLPLAERLARHLDAPRDRHDALQQIAKLELDGLGLDEIDELLIELAAER
jgi:DEAD/DEAH box helicase/Helicase conserved C-terminal domain